MMRGNSCSTGYTPFEQRSHRRGVCGLPLWWQRRVGLDHGAGVVVDRGVAVIVRKPHAEKAFLLATSTRRYFG